MSGERYEYPHAPPHLVEALRLWGTHEQLQPGGLVTAILEGDLHGAVQVAHHSVTIEALRDLSWYCSMELPSAAWGSPAAVKRWRATVVHVQDCPARYTHGESDPCRGEGCR